MMHNYKHQLFNTAEHYAELINRYTADVRNLLEEKEVELPDGIYELINIKELLTQIKECNFTDEQCEIINKLMDYSAHGEALKLIEQSDKWDDEVEEEVDMFVNFATDSIDI